MTFGMEEGVSGLWHVELSVFSFQQPGISNRRRNTRLLALLLLHGSVLRQVTDDGRRGRAGRSSDGADGLGLFAGAFVGQVELLFTGAG